MLLSVLIAAGALSAAAVSTAADSSETTTFGIDGVALASLGPNYLETGISDLTPRPDGGFVLDRSGERETFLLDGAPDPAAPPVGLPERREVITAADGKSLVLEEMKYGEARLSRVNPDGSLDTSFGDEGTSRTRLSEPDAVFELGSGKIAAIRTTIEGARTSTGLLEVVVLNHDGSLDRGAGFQEAEQPISMDNAVRDIVPMTDGGALVVDESFLFELRPDGTLNDDFDHKRFRSESDFVGAAFLPDGSIEVAGRAPGGGAGSGTTVDLALFRFTATGEPVSAFGKDGVRRFDFGSEESPNAALWGPDGSVVVTGRSESHYACRGQECKMVPIVAAFDAAGELDEGFGEGGILRLSGLDGPAEILSEVGGETLARRSDGSILVGGNAAPEATTGFVANVSSTGSLVPSFGEGGIVRLRTPVPAGQAMTGLSAVPEGGLIAAAVTELDAGETKVLIRYAPDGSLDSSFGDGGYVKIEGDGRYPRGLAVAGEEALTSLGGGPRGHLLMYGTATGEPVSTFGESGSVALPKGVRVTALAFARGGDPLVLAARRKGRSEILRYLPNGELDRTFGRAGAVDLRLPGGATVDASSLTVSADGTIVIGGSAGHLLALGSLRADGSPSPQFGSGGWKLAGTGGAAPESELATLGDDGSHIYLAASVESRYERHHIVLMRFDRSGRADLGFGDRGLLSAPYSRATRPSVIVPGRRAVRVVVDIGPRPILSFAQSGKVRRSPPREKVEFVRSVVGSVSGERLILGWSHFDSPSLTETSYIADRPLGR